MVQIVADDETWRAPSAALDELAPGGEEALGQRTAACSPAERLQNQPGQAAGVILAVPTVTKELLQRGLIGLPRWRGLAAQQPCQ